jgi:acetyl-CoA acetyltransferase
MASSHGKLLLHLLGSKARGAIAELFICSGFDNAMAHTEAEAGVPVAVIQAQVGHMSSAKVDYYCHISQAAIHQGAQKIEQQSCDLLDDLGLTSRTVLHV